MEQGRVMLDTSAYSALLRGSTALRNALEEVDEFFFNPVVIGELLAGFRRGSAEQKNRAILNDFLALPRTGIVSIDEETAERYAVIQTYLRRQGTPLPTNDIWIAASAMQHGLKVFTTDRHYLNVHQVIVA